MENLFKKSGSGHIYLGNILIQWGSISAQVAQYTLIYPIPYKDSPSVAISTWGSNGTVTHSGRSRTQCPFSSNTRSIGLDWIAIGKV